MINSGFCVLLCDSCPKLRLSSLKLAIAPSVWLFCVTVASSVSTSTTRELTLASSCLRLCSILFTFEYSFSNASWYSAMPANSFCKLQFSLFCSDTSDSNNWVFCILRVSSSWRAFSYSFSTWTRSWLRRWQSLDATSCLLLQEDKSDSILEISISSILLSFSSLVLMYEMASMSFSRRDDLSLYFWSSSTIFKLLFLISTTSPSNFIFSFLRMANSFLSRLHASSLVLKAAVILDDFSSRNFCDFSNRAFSCVALSSLTFSSAVSSRRPTTSISFDVNWVWGGFRRSILPTFVFPGDFIEVFAVILVGEGGGLSLL